MTLDLKAALESLRTGEESTRKQAVDALGASLEQAAIAPLLHAVGDESWPVRQAAAAHLEKFPEEARTERSELLLRLALIHRLKGDLSEEKRSLAQATAIDDSLAAVYETLIATDGSVSGPEERILEHLRGGIRTELSRNDGFRMTDSE